MTASRSLFHNEQSTTGMMYDIETLNKHQDFVVGTCARKGIWGCFACRAFRQEVLHLTQYLAEFWFFFTTVML